MASRMQKYNEAWLKRHGNPNGFIYLITNVVTGDTYVGSTTSPIKKRWYQHISAARSGKTTAVATNIREWGEECFEIKVIHDCLPGEDKRELENYYLDEYAPTLNHNLAKKDDNIFLDFGNLY